MSKERKLQILLSVVTGLFLTSLFTFAFLDMFDVLSTTQAGIAVLVVNLTLFVIAVILEMKIDKEEKCHTTKML